MTRKLLAGLFAALLLTAPMHVLAVDSDSALHGTDHGLCWQLADHVLTISGEGGIAGDADRHAADAPAWSAYAEAIYEIIIEEGVTGADAYAFARYPNLCKLTLPSTFSYLAPYALYGCAQLSEIDGLSYVTAFDFQCLTGTAFSQATPFVITDGRLYYAECTELTVPEGVTEIMPYAFGNLTGTAFQHRHGDCPVSVYLPDSVEIIHENAFAFCTSLTDIRLPEALREIGDHAFYNCANLGSVRLGSQVEHIGTQAFFNCRMLRELTIENPDAVIGGNAYGDVYDWQAVILANARYTEEQRSRLLNQLQENPTLLDAEMSQFAVHFPGTRRYSDISFHSLPYANNPAFLTVSGTVCGYLDSSAQVYAEAHKLAFVPIDGTPLPGDVTLDGFVDIMDVIRLNKFLLGAATLSDRAHLAADFISDDTVDASDSLAILRYVIGIR